MKKIIALAVAGAFVAPVYAADVSVSGEVEYTITNSDGLNTFSAGTQDITVGASEELANGMSVSAFVRIDTDAGSDGTSEIDSALTVSGGFGSVSVGKDAGLASPRQDVSDVASGGGGADGEIGDGITEMGSVKFTPNLGVAGVTAQIGYTMGDGQNEEVTSYGIAYEVGGFGIAYAAADTDLATDETATIVSASFETGPFYIGVDSISNQDGVDGDNTTGLGMTYTMGAIQFQAERMSVEDGGGNIDVTDTVYGVEYDLGALDIYVMMETDETASSASAKTSTENTIVGIEYKF